MIEQQSRQSRAGVYRFLGKIKLGIGIRVWAS